MRIAILSRYQNTISRGAESFVTELSSHLAKNNSVDVLSDSDTDSLRKILKGKYDIVMPINGRLESLRASLGRVLGGYKLVIVGESGVGRDDIWNIAVSKPDAFIALTDYMADWAKRWAWGTKVVKIPNGVDTNKFKPSGEKLKINLKKPIVISVGALTLNKHHERTISALEKLPDVSLLIVGKGELEQDLDRLAKERLGDRFKIISAPFEDLPKIYRSADLFVLPSWDREAFGIVYIEAMASGLPVVAPDDSPRREIVGPAGILVDVTNQKKYALAIEEALNRDWKGIPRQQAENFSWDKIAEKYERLFKGLILR